MHIQKYIFSFLKSLHPSTGPVPAKPSCRSGSVTWVWTLRTYLHFLRKKKHHKISKQQSQRLKLSKHPNTKPESTTNKPKSETCNRVTKTKMKQKIHKESVV